MYLFFYFIHLFIHDSLIMVDEMLHRPTHWKNVFRR